MFEGRLSMVIGIRKKMIEVNPIIDDDIMAFHFKINNSIIVFSITEFNSLSEYNSYTEHKGEEIFNDLVEERCTIVGYDWSITNKFGLSLRDMFHVIQNIGTSYAMDFLPDIIYYEAMNPKLHKIYTKMFPIKGYYLKKVSGKSYIYMRDCKDNE